MARPNSHPICNLHSSISNLQFPSSNHSTTMNTRKRQTTDRKRKSRASPSTSPAHQLTRSPAHPPPPRLYHLVIPCRDAQHQRTLYEQLTRAGHPCRVITL